MIVIEEDRVVMDFAETDSACEVREVRPAPPAPIVSRYFFWKGIVSRIAGTCLLLPAAALMLPLIVLIRCSSKGPAIYRQIRVGRRGRTFMMYKLRTMRHDAEANCGPVWCGVHDPRITRVGKMLRKLHLDELPQLVNVVRGEMDLFGPRPERPEFVRVLQQQVPGYGDRHLVAPGITGLAQINLPPDTDVDSVRRKVTLDRYYIEHAGPLMDLRMFTCTILRVLGLQGELVIKLMGLNYRHLVDRPEPIEDAVRKRRSTAAVPVETVRVASRSPAAYVRKSDSSSTVCEASGTC